MTNASRSRGRRAIIIHLSNDGSEYRGLSTLVPACLLQIQLFFDLTYASNIVLLDLLQSFISSIINFTKRDYIYNSSMGSIFLQIIKLEIKEFLVKERYLEKRRIIGTYLLEKAASQCVHRYLRSPV